MSDVLNNFRLDGRTAIVTGVGPGIGQHVAKAYAEVGANVVCAARTTERIERIAGEINAAGGTAIAVTTDVAKQSDLENLVRVTHDSFGPVHVLFNNATAGVVLPLDRDPWDTPDEVWQAALATNLLAPYRLGGMLVDEMRAHGKGSIINVLTCAAFTPIPPQMCYGSTKAGLHMLTRYMAKVGGSEVRVNAICPGSTTPDGQVSPLFAEHLAKNAIRRTGVPSEYVGAALLLASDASSYTTGSVIFVEGGRVNTIS
jgi:NAD(P)-dependent dehydrogenase (short-subunit alcohol dehydrogenase family)